MALLSYRAIPLPWCNLSPAELLMGRCIRTPLPQTNEQLVPTWSYLQKFRQQNRDFKDWQKRDLTGITEHVTVPKCQMTPRCGSALKVSQYVGELFPRPIPQGRMSSTLRQDRCVGTALTCLLRPIIQLLTCRKFPRSNRPVGS